MVKSDSDLSGREKGFPNGSAYTKELSEKDELCSKLRREVLKMPLSKGSIFELQGGVGVFFPFQSLLALQVLIGFIMILILFS